MRSRNVILTLIVTIAALLVVVVKINFFESPRKITFNRNPSRVEYAPLALCQIDCNQISLNQINQAIKRGNVIFSDPDVPALPCTTFAISGNGKNGMEIRVMIMQCGKKAKILSVYFADGILSCNCHTEKDKYKNF